MIHPSYVELMKVVNEETALVGEEPVVNSRYSIVCATAKRARQIIDGDYPYISRFEGMKPLSIAVEELYEGKLKILTDEEVAEKEEELSSYIEKKKQQEAVYAARDREEEKMRREQESVSRTQSEDDYEDEDFEQKDEAEDAEDALDSDDVDSDETLDDDIDEEEE